MANICIKSINYVTSGKKQKFISLDTVESDSSLSVWNDVYAINIDKYQNNYTNSNTNSNNLFSMFDNTNNVIIHNLYNIKDFCIKLTVRENNIDIPFYAPDINSNFLGITQLENYTYGLTDKTTNGFNKQITDLNDQKLSIDIKDLYLIQDTNYNYNIKSEDIKTFLYKTDNSFDINYNLSGIEYNKIFEFQNESIFNSYEDGDIYGNCVICKNMYDQSYSMNMSSDNDLINCRQYHNIGTCGNQLFLTYTNDINYKKVNTVSDIGDNIKNIQVEQKQLTDENNNKLFQWQKVENIKSINRFSTTNNHRSNIFSIKINNTGIDVLEESEQLKKLKSKIIFDVESNVKELVKKLAPVTSQLFKVEIN